MGSPKPGHTPPLAEDEMVERIRRVLGDGIRPGAIGSVGWADRRDDAASVAVPGGGSLVVSVDSVVDGVHVDLALGTPADVGWKALMGALSDLAAMGARPVGALVALCVPGGAGDGTLALGVMEGVAEAATAAGCPVVGGDVSSAPTLMVSVTVLGSTDGGEPVRRVGARAGDAVLVTGACGGSAAALRRLRAGEVVAGNDPYRRPVARLAQGELARVSGVHAMIDISDGLALDLHRLADASHIGFALHGDAIPVATGATMEEALGGGEDYELVMTLAEADVDDLMARFTSTGLQRPCRIGDVLANTRQRSLDGVALGQQGWQHILG